MTNHETPGKYFVYAHLPEGPLRETSALIHDLAHKLANKLPDCEQKTLMFQDLLRAKDCAVRAALEIANE